MPHSIKNVAPLKAVKMVEFEPGQVAVVGFEEALVVADELETVDDPEEVLMEEESSS